MSLATNGYASHLDIKARDFHPGMGRAVAERTILRKRESGQWEDWRDVAGRVAQGNAYLCPDKSDVYHEFRTLRDHIAAGRVLMSGRHLQHGDADQPHRNMEVFTNCATANSSFISFYLLLNGSGVGRCYDDALMLVDWDDAPAVRCVLSEDHPDFDYSAHESARDAEHKYGRGPGVTWFAVPDSREGWAKALELVETMAYERAHRRDLVVLDFSGVRPQGSPIDGMQGRPSCGPVPTMNAFAKAMTIRGGGLPRWKQALFVDHYFAESVLVGGARRAARIATKTWRDESVLDFIAAKRPIEFRGKSPAEIQAIRAEAHPTAFLWSANMSVTVDAEFWAEINRLASSSGGFWCENSITRVFTATTKSAYYDGTGEPGFINTDRLAPNLDGVDRLDQIRCLIGSAKYGPEKRTRGYLDALYEAARGGSTPFLTNPCGEVTLAAWGAFCVIADVVPYHAETLDEAEDAVRAATRALIRVNTMDSVYQHEVARTNRIGVGLTGIHEFAWKFFGYGFRDLLDEERSRDFWMTLARLKRAVDDEAATYSAKLGMATPHTNTCIKPAGCRPWNALTTTDQGILTLQELFEEHPNDEQWGDITRPIRAYQDGDSRRLTKTFVNGEAEVFRVQLAYGLTVESTANHPWFVVGYHTKGNLAPINKWVATENLEPGHVLDVRVGVYVNDVHAPLAPIRTTALRMRGKANPITQPTLMNPDLAWMLGYLWGDGAMSAAKYRLRWTDRNLDNLAKANRVFEEQFGVTGIIHRCNNKNDYTLEIGNVELWHWLLKNGVYKYHAEEIDLIPRVVRSSATEDILAFLAGLIDADGAIARQDDKTVILAAAEHRFAQHVQNVGWAVGVAFGLSHNTVGENFQVHRKSMYLLTVSSASTATAIRTLVRHSNKMAIADAEPREWRYDRPGRSLRRILGKVEEVSTIGVMPTYDVEVDDNHWFYAGAVKSHNTTSKLFGLTEGAHLPAMPFYVRWVQFRTDDPLVATYRAAGYEIRELATYRDVAIVGFPTTLAITGLGMGAKLVTAGEATVAEQYRWLLLLEKYWIRGVDEAGEPLATDTGNQISYTLKYDPATVSYHEFAALVRRYQPLVKCCAVMPSEDNSSYEYLPEQPVTKAEFEEMAAQIRRAVAEDVDQVHVDCGVGGACPIEFAK